MAEKYGFDYELVQYKWPRWLHQQTEKQRIIWGYGILPISANMYCLCGSGHRYHGECKVQLPFHIGKSFFLPESWVSKNAKFGVENLDFGKI